MTFLLHFLQLQVRLCSGGEGGMKGIPGSGAGLGGGGGGSIRLVTGGGVKYIPGFDVGLGGGSTRLVTGGGGGGSIRLVMEKGLSVYLDLVQDSGADPPG